MSKIQQRQLIRQRALFLAKRFEISYAPRREVVIL